MKNLFEPARVTEVRERLAKLTPQSERRWGKMTVGQMVAHCAVSFETATDERRSPRLVIGRLLGWAVKPLMLRNDDPLKKNSPTAPEFIMRDDRNLDLERARLNASIDRFASGGPAACTTHPHAFFGSMTPEQWATLMYKHLDHHFRQFGE